MDITTNSYLDYKQKNVKGSILPRRLKTFLAEPGTGILIAGSGMAIGPLVAKTVTSIVDGLILPSLAIIFSYIGLSKISWFKNFIFFKNKTFKIYNIFYDLIIFILTVYIVFFGSEIIKNEDGLWGLIYGTKKLVKFAQYK
jgi:large-conductance mechanosensitive channel